MLGCVLVGAPKPILTLKMTPKMTSLAINTTKIPNDLILIPKINDDLINDLKMKNK